MSDEAELHLVNIQFHKNVQLQVPASVEMLLPLACDSMVLRLMGSMLRGSLLFSTWISSSTRATRPARSPSGPVMASTTSRYACSP
jgi:hypothetical protein